VAIAIKGWFLYYWDCWSNILENKRP